MSNIDNEALREKFEVWAEEAGALPWGILKKHRNQDGSYPGPHYTYMWHAWNACHAALLNELKAAEKRNAELSSNNDSAHKALLRARHRTVTLPTGYSVRPGHPVNEGERGVMIPKEGGDWLHRFDVEHALIVAGIGIKGE